MPVTTKLREVFQQRFKALPQRISRAPGRINPKNSDKFSGIKKANPERLAKFSKSLEKLLSR